MSAVLFFIVIPVGGRDDSGSGQIQMQLPALNA